MFLFGCYLVKRQQLRMSQKFLLPASCLCFSPGTGWLGVMASSMLYQLSDFQFFFFFFQEGSFLFSLSLILETSHNLLGKRKSCLCWYITTISCYICPKIFKRCKRCPRSISHHFKGSFHSFSHWVEMSRMNLKIIICRNAVRDAWDVWRKWGLQGSTLLFPRLSPQGHLMGSWSLSD